MVLPDDEHRLARRAVVAWRHVAVAAVYDVEPLYDRELERSRFLDDSSAHGDSLSSFLPPLITRSCRVLRGRSGGGIGGSRSVKCAVQRAPSAR
jgi:hypothetical protein